MSLTNQSEVEQKLKKAQRIIQWNSEVNDIIFNAQSSNELIEKICKSTIGTAKLGISLFINLDSSIRLETANWSIKNEGYLAIFESHDYLKIQLENTSSFTTEIIATQYFCSNNIESDVRLILWKTAIINKGYKSLFAIPIIVAYKLITVINFYSTESNYFKEDEFNRILQLKEGIVFCINAMNLISLNNDLKLQNDKLLEEGIQKEYEIDNFSYVLSHYIRKHVVNIMGLNKLFLKEKIDGKPKELIGHISSEVKKLDNVIKDVSIILNFRNIPTEEMVSTNFEALLQEIMHEEQSYLQLNQIQIRYNFSNCNEIDCYRNSLKKIFTKFIYNAIRFSQTNTTPIIEIKSELNNGFIHIHFKDYGIGIDLNRRPYDFFKNYSLNLSGNGFGLLLIKKHLENIKGKIEVKSILDKWTEFIIYLPIINKN